MTHRHTTNYAKNYCNRTLIVKVIVQNIVTCFLGHSVYICTVYWRVYTIVWGTQCSSGGHWHWTVFLYFFVYVRSAVLIVLWFSFYLFLSMYSTWLPF